MMACHHSNVEEEGEGEKWICHERMLLEVNVDTCSYLLMKTYVTKEEGEREKKR